MAVLLQDASTLIRPRAVTELTEEPGAQSHPSSTCLLVLSDIADLFARVSKHAHVGHKLKFYAAHLLSIPAFVLNAVADEVEQRAKVVNSETLPPTVPMSPNEGKGRGGSRIEEL